MLEAAYEQLMPSTFTQFKNDALAKPGVKDEYDALEDEYALLAEELKARAVLDDSQAEVSEKKNE